MKRIFILFVLITGISITGIAQKSKMNFELAKKMKYASADEVFNVYIKGDVATLKQIVNNNKGKVKYIYGDIAAAVINKTILRELASSNAIQRIECYTTHLKPMADTMVIQNNIVPVHNGTAPLSQAYKGNGIVIGLIDTGIDITHPDFKTSTGNTRIKYLWDQTLANAPNTPMPYNYGQEWDNTGIDNGDAAAHDPTYYYGHGTHITGIAAGNGLAIGKFAGVAPEADIVFVALDFNSGYPGLVTDAIDYIYSKAQAMGKPCVINCSFGDYYGSHDGKDLQAQMVKNMITAQNGRSLVAAAGNGGNVNFHLGYTVTADTNFTLFNADAGGNAYIQLWADTSNFKNVQFSIGADQMSPSHSLRGRINFSNILSHIGVLQEDTLYNNGNRIGIIQSYGDVLDNVYSMEFNILADSVDYKWRLITTGTGKFDTWSFDVIGSGLPSFVTMPDSSYYKMPDSDQSIVSSFQCLDEVITVGNYINRNRYIDYNNNLVYDPSRIVNAIAPSSSKGPTRDGRIKPDIAATGDWVLSCIAAPWVNDFITYIPDQLAQGGYHKRGNGTSASSPVVAGTVALYLEENPTATAIQIKQAVTSCTKLDTFTGASLPDNTWGYGKLDAFTTLTGCVITSGNEISEDPFEGFVYPNPSVNDIHIRLNTAAINWNDKIQIRLYNVLGQTLKLITITEPQFAIMNLAGGTYFCDLLINEKTVATEKVIILQQK